MRILPVLYIGLALISGCGNTAGAPLTQAASPPAEATATAYTTRIPGSNPEMQAIALAQAVYPATREENAAGAIILAPQDAPLAFTAMHRITHMPVNAPLLYLNPQGLLSEATKQEMKRLRPDGVVQDGRVQVFIVGDTDPSVRRAVEDELKYEAREFRTNDPVELAEVLDRWQAAIKADHPDEVIVSALDHPEGIAHGMGAMGWNAHMGKGFAWVNSQSIPEATHKILRRRWGEDGAYIYLTGGPEVISHEVARSLSQYGLVHRIHGEDIFATNSVNAGYKDFGRNFGWWWGWEGRSFDWGISQAGHNFIFASADDILGAIPSVLLGHMGKHGPLLLVRSDGAPEPVERYLEMVRPFVSGPTETIRNHGWIIGDEERIALATQRQIHRLLSPSGVDAQPPASRQATQAKKEP